MSWKKLTSEEKYRSPWMRVTEDQVETDSGKTLTWSVIHQSPSAMVIPWDGERFVLIDLYRYAIDQRSWEFPSGGVAEASTKVAAERELKEETGLTAQSCEYIGEFYLACASNTELMTLYIATDLTQGKTDPDAGEEGIQSHRVTYQELCDMINEGKIRDAATIAAVGYLHTSGWISRHIFPQ